MKKISATDTLALSIPERIQLVEEALTVQSFLCQESRSKDNNQYYNIETGRTKHLPPSFLVLLLHNIFP